MTDAGVVLATLQHGDSFFPSGAISFSWGLETLSGSGQVTSAQEVESFVLGQLHGRWKNFDRSIVAAAHRVAQALEQVTKIDHLVEAQTLAAELRVGSRRTGAALLAVHERLATPRAAQYREIVFDGHAPGHLAVVQGFLWSNLGIPAKEATLLSAHGLCVSLLGAALRLGMVGHVDVQRILARVRQDIVAMFGVEPPPVEYMHSFTPQAEIAVMRHEQEDMRLFAN